MIGHLVGAAGIASALAAIGAIRDGVIPPTANLHTPDPECDLDYVPLVARAGQGRDGRRQRLRLRWPERGDDLPGARGVAGPTPAQRGSERAALERLDRGDVLG